MVRSLCLFRAAGLHWQAQHGGWVLSIIAKGTFELLPTESRLSDRQEDVCEEDNFWNDDPRRSVYAPSDLAPFKPRADVVLVGHAFSPNGELLRSLIARLVVGELDKSIEVVGERLWSPEGDVREGARFAKMPLRYERAAGGPETWNPVGIRLDAKDGYGRTPLPNLQPPATVVSTRGDFIEPIGFGPVAPNWPQRRERLAQHASDWSPTLWNRSPLPDGLDFGFFNAAPRDQQVPALRDDERLVLENLNAEHARLVTSLPGVHPKAFVQRSGAAPFAIRMTCDTLWIDTDRALATLTWRAQLPLENGQEVRVFVAMEEKGQSLAWSDVEPLVRRARMGAKVSQAAAEARRSEMELERTVAPESDAGERTLLPFARQGEQGGGLPFAGGPGQTLTFAASGRDAESSTITEPGRNPLGAAPAWLGSGGAPPPPPRPQSQSGFPAPAAAAPPPAPPPLIAAVPHGDSPWAAQPGRAHVAPPRDERSWSPPDLAGPTARMASPVHPAPAPERPWLQSSPPAPPPAVVAHGAQAALAGAVAASDAAAAAAPVAQAVGPQAAAPAPAAGSHRREYVELLWFDPDKVRLIRGQRAFRDALSRKSGGDEWLDTAEAAPEPQEEKDRRDVYRVLSRGRPVDGEGIAQAFVEAADEEVFANPVVLVGGDLQFYFDEIETLRTTLAVAAPLAGGDKRMRETSDAAAEVLKGRCTASIADGLTARIREAFVQSNRTLPANYLEATTERMLLEERHYQKRTMLGERRIRALLAPNAASAPLPCYLPEALEKQLPLFPRLRVHVVAQAVGQQDQNENQQVALVAFALGRVMPIPGRGR